MMRRIASLILFAFAAAACGPLCAQSLDAFKARLATPAGASGARVTTEEYGSAASAVRQTARTTGRLRGYRVCIYMDNGQDGQDARAGAVAARNLFTETYPGVKVYMAYENPYFKVSVGDCLTSEEAIILKNRIAATFPKAFPKREELSLADLLE